MDTIYNIAQNTGFLGGRIVSSTSIDTTTTSDEPSANLGDTHQFVRVIAIGNPCHILFGTFGSTTATTSHTYLPTGTAEIFYTDSGNSIAARTTTGTGTLYIDVLSFPEQF